MNFVYRQSLSSDSAECLTLLCFCLFYLPRALDLHEDTYFFPFPMNVSWCLRGEPVLCLHGNVPRDQNTIIIMEESKCSER